MAVQLGHRLPVSVYLSSSGVVPVPEDWMKILRVRVSVSLEGHFFGGLRVFSRGGLMAAEMDERIRSKTQAKSSMAAAGRTMDTDSQICVPLAGSVPNRRGWLGLVS